jgi:hypothetical protein
MFDAALYAAEAAEVDWHELADEVFPVDVLLAAPITSRTVFIR